MGLLHVSAIVCGGQRRQIPVGARATQLWAAWCERCYPNPCPLSEQHALLCPEPSLHPEDPAFWWPWEEHWWLLGGSLHTWRPCVFFLLALVTVAISKAAVGPDLLWNVVWENPSPPSWELQGTRGMCQVLDVGHILAGWGRWLWRGTPESSVVNSLVVSVCVHLFSFITSSELLI